MGVERELTPTPTLTAIVPLALHAITTLVNVKGLVSWVGMALTLTAKIRLSP